MLHDWQRIKVIYFLTDQKAVDKRRAFHLSFKLIYLKYFLSVEVEFSNVKMRLTSLACVLFEQLMVCTDARTSCILTKSSCLQTAKVPENGQILTKKVSKCFLED